MLRTLLTVSLLSLCASFSMAQTSVFSDCPNASEIAAAPSTVQVCVRAGGCGNSQGPGCAVSEFYYGKSFSSYESCGVIVTPSGGIRTSLYENVGQQGDVGLDPAISLDRTVEVFRKSKCAQDTANGGNACVRIRNATTGDLLSWTTLQCK